MEAPKTLKIEIKKQATLAGDIYFSLYVNGQYQTLSSKEEEMIAKAKSIEDLFLAGAMEETITYTKDLTL